MEFTKGMVVRTKAGHDKGNFFVVLGIENGFAMIADGRYRPISKPKRKNLVHLSKTNTVIPEQFLNNDSDIRRELKPFYKGIGSDLGGI